MKSLFNSDKKILALSNCIHCGRKFSPSEIDAAKQIKKRAKTSLVHITCSNCQSSMLLGLMNDRVMGVIGVGTDLSVGEVRRKFGGKKITIDDVIEMSESINQL